MFLSLDAEGKEFFKENVMDMQLFLESVLGIIAFVCVICGLSVLFFKPNW